MTDINQEYARHLLISGATDTFVPVCIRRARRLHKGHKEGRTFQSTFELYCLEAIIRLAPDYATEHSINADDIDCAAVVLIILDPPTTERTLEEWVALAESLVESVGTIPGHKWLAENGYTGLRTVMRKHPYLFVHIKRKAGLLMPESVTHTSNPC